MKDRIPAHSITDLALLIAEKAHAGQTDKTGVPYIEHVKAVAEGVRAYGPDLYAAALLHDVVEDTHHTASTLLAAGIPGRVTGIVLNLTKDTHPGYTEMLHTITRDPEALLVKISDNAHNSREDRLRLLPGEKRERLRLKYRKAREILWPHAHNEEILRTVGTVNPLLLDDPHARALLEKQ